MDPTLAAATAAAAASSSVGVNKYSALPDIVSPSFPPSTAYLPS